MGSDLNVRVDSRVFRWIACESRWVDVMYEMIFGISNEA